MIWAPTWMRGTREPGRLALPAMDADASPDETSRTAPDLAAIEVDLADVELALARLDAGSYWTCEVTGKPIPDEVLNRFPTRRRLSGDRALFAS
jgi:RNA polymerase-binding transcription factor DksA